MLSALSSEVSFFIALCMLCVGAVGALVFRKHERVANWWSHGAAIIASLFALFSAGEVLLRGDGFSFILHTTLPQLSVVVIADPLAAVFITAIAIVSLCASVYGIGYMEHALGTYSLGSFGFFYNAFILGMLLVVTAQQAVFFLVAWEIMSLASYFLVVYEHGKRENVEAGTLYFIMTHVGTLFIFFAFLLLFSATGTFDFSAIKQQSGAIAPSLKNIVFLLALIGFGVKAGVIPLHIWLPSAHPSAPSHVSALMSGVMIKTGIYMFIRLFADVLGVPPLWWGIVMLVCGALSALLGVLYALTEHDIKRLLAYHSIENIGIILLGLGSALLFLSRGERGLALIGFGASLFHVCNHAIFKALLFLGAGSVINQTHTRNMEAYGGLIRAMPQTALYFLVGSLAISALPPFNGFFSEWMTFQALFAGMRYFDVALQWPFVLGAAALACTGGLAAACFVKAFGATFLARPRSSEAERAHESARSLRFGMALLALLALLGGIFASPVSGALVRAAGSLSALHGETMPLAQTHMSIGGFATVYPMAIFLTLLLFSTLVWLAVSVLRRRVTLNRTWDCGVDLSPRMEITATGFSRSLIVMWKGILRPSVQESIEYHDASMRYFPRHRSIASSIKDIYRVYFYGPVERIAVLMSGYAKRIQGGDLNAYVLYTFAALIMLLLILV